MKKINKKKILSGIVLSSLLFTSGLEAKAEFSSMGDWALSKREVYAYDRDDFSSERIGILDINRDVYRILSGENMDLVNCGDFLFFVEKDSIQSVSFPESDVTYQQTSFNGSTTTKVNLRVGTGTDSNKIMTLDANSLVEVIALSDNGWYLVDYNNILGFVSSEYVKAIDMNEINEQMMALPSVYKVVQATTEVNVRSGPSTEYSVLGKLSSGHKLQMNRRLDNGWYEVERNGEIGYVCGDYVKEKYVVDGNYYQIVSMNTNANAYDRPYGNVIGTLPKYEACFIYGEVDDFFLAECEGHVGYIKKCDCTRLNNIFIIIDISDQTLRLYDGCEELLVTDVVTGKSSTPTSVGLFTISERQSPRVLKGDDYEVEVKYWLRFYKGQGVHSMNRRVFGVDANYQENGSHGCVNVPLKKMKTIYETANVGDDVLVKN